MLDLSRGRKNAVEAVFVKTRARKPDVRVIGYFHDQEQIAVIHRTQDMLKDFLDSLIRSEKERALPAVPRGT